MRTCTFVVLSCLLLPTSPSQVFAQPGARGQLPPPTRFNPLLHVFDADQDGQLSTDEIAQAADKLKALDRNQDGKLNDQEILEALPRGRRVAGPDGQGFRLGRGGPRSTGGAAVLEKEALAQDEFEKRILSALKEIQQGPRFANVSDTDGRLLRLLAEAIDARRVVEIGTSTGESAVWLAMALEPTGGHIYTHEIDSGRAEVAQQNFQLAGVDGLITIVMGDAHETVQRYRDPDDPLYVDTSNGESIDLLFLDADKEGYVDYLDKLLPLVRPGGLVIAHNMNTRQADSRYVQAITENPQLETLILLKEGTGVGVTLKKR